MNEEKKSSFAKWLERGLVFGCGMIFIIAILFLLSLNLGTTQTVAPSPSRGVFYGQVVDALTLNPIANATVNIYSASSFNDLICTIFTNESGYYQTMNITLYSNFRIVARAEGYYVKPLEYSEETIDAVGNRTYYISPTKLFRISHNVRLYCAFDNGVGSDPTHHDPFIISDISNITLYVKRSANETISFNILMINREGGTSVGTPYFGNSLQMNVSPNNENGLFGGLIVYPEGKLSIDALPYAYPYNPQATIHYSISLTTAASGNYRFTALFQEQAYPAIYNVPIYNSAILSFNIQVGE